MGKIINKIYSTITKNKPVVVALTLLTVVTSLYALWPNNSDVIDDRDFMDYKGATNPKTDFTFEVHNPKPQNRLDYEMISLNNKINGLYHSNFRLAITVPQGGWFSLEDELNSLLFLSCDQTPPQKDDIIGSTSYLSNGQQKNFSHLRIECVSENQIIDDGTLFFLKNNLE